jgi:hypothetical protein
MGKAPKDTVQQDDDQEIASVRTDNLVSCIQGNHCFHTKEQQAVNKILLIELKNGHPSFHEIQIQLIRF